MKLVIEIDVDNDSMQTADGLSSVLVETTRSIVKAASADVSVLWEISRTIKDDNGNTVGRWKVVTS